MKFIQKIYTETLEIKQSKFIAHIMPYSQYKETLQKLKDSHPKARHFVVAYRYLNEFNQIVEHSSDDGEPKGTSGKPSLFVLQGTELINSAVIIVRYFGGTKLGTGGLVRAYSDSVNLVLESAVLKKYELQIVKEISFEYANLRKIEYECEILNINIIDKLFDTKLVYKIEATQENIDKFLTKFERILTVK